MTTSDSAARRRPGSRHRANRGPEPSPYVNQQKWIYNSSGNLIHVYAVGVIERIPLPDGDAFLSAGRTDQITRDNPAALTPDVGHSGDVASLCAALAG